MSVVLKNIMEEIVIRKVDELIGGLGCCKCEQCRLDMASYVLNRVKPKYVVSLEGELLSKLDSLSVDYEVDIVANIVKAAQVINNNPHHKKVLD